MELLRENKYWKPTDADGIGCGQYLYKTLPQQMKRRDEQRQALGWTADKHGGGSFTPYRGWPIADGMTKADGSGG